MSASYDDLAKHLDAHLAELDIESFRAEDINSILNLKSNMEFKTSSVFNTARRRTLSVGEEKEFLFSPPSGADQHYLSTDSLDRECLLDSRVSFADPEGHDELCESIRVSSNCQANKENYQLAFKDEDSYSGSTDSESSKASATGRKVSWNNFNHSNETNQR